MEPLPACPGTLQVHCVPGCGVGVGGGNLADTPRDWGVGKVPTPQEESWFGQTSELPPCGCHPHNGPTRPQGTEAQRRKEKPCGWVAGFPGDSSDSQGLANQAQLSASLGTPWLDARRKFLASGPHPPLNTSRSLWAERKPDRAGDSEVAILSPVCARSPPPGGWGAGGPAAGGQGRQREPGVGSWDRVLFEGGGDPVKYVTSDPSACTLQLAGQRPLPTHPQPSRAFCPAGRPCHPAPHNTPPGILERTSWNWGLGAGRVLPGVSDP